jgi:hypothetical protein
MATSLGTTAGRLTTPVAGHDATTLTDRRGVTIPGSRSASNRPPAHRRAGRSTTGRRKASQPDSLCTARTVRPIPSLRGPASEVLSKPRRVVLLAPSTATPGTPSFPRRPAGARIRATLAACARCRPRRQVRAAIPAGQDMPVRNPAARNQAGPKAPGRKRPARKAAARTPAARTPAARKLRAPATPTRGEQPCRTTTPGMAIPGTAIPAKAIRGTAIRGTASPGRATSCQAIPSSTTPGDLPAG